MTVVLIGVGLDQTNSRPYPQLYDDGSFEYFPIPEAHDTTYDGTYGSLARLPRNGGLSIAEDGDETIAEALDEIYPQEDAGETLAGTDLATHPVHHDPNFAELTYGEVKAGNRNQIQHLDPNDQDVLAFYTGLTGPNSGVPHRYIIGYFTVNSITDFGGLIGDTPKLHDQRLAVSELPLDTREAVENALREHSENAHVKRFLANGTIDPDLLIVDGTKPGGLLDRAYRISKTAPGGHAFKKGIEELFQVQTTKSGRRTGFLGGFKKAHRLNLTGAQFIDIVS